MASLHCIAPLNTKPMTLSHHQIQTAGFWRRSLAFVLDTLMIGFITTIITIGIFGPEYIAQLQHAESMQPRDWIIVILEQGIPALWTIGFWIMWMATPGKMLMDIKIVDAKTTGRAGIGQLVLRYLGYLLSALPLGLGFLWIIIDKKNQGWHDKLASTLVIMQDESLHTLDAYHG